MPDPKPTTPAKTPDTAPKRNDPGAPIGPGHPGKEGQDEHRKQSSSEGEGQRGGQAPKR